ncbi:SixA phosphatase family protein [Aquimarina sediminis]|uniref:SixA phosphatase family protein n=1 Tax=Aquimarina sediminis TaxID=2070536 RepID=UPI000CA03C4E|nr:phosphoglycerate mutase family protein [Aquimarina sediminis]
MKYVVLLSIFLLSLTSSAQSTGSKQPETTTYFFIRHAEKDLSNPENRNPELTKEGKNRAENWAKMLADVPVDMVYSTDYIRTKKTAEPIAKSKNLEVILYNPKNLNSPDFQKNTKGKITVIVGHSNTTPSFVNKIIGKKKYHSIDEKIYGKVFIINITGDVITDTLLRFN